MRSKGGVVLAALLAIGLAMGAAGCGDDGEGEATETTAPRSTECANVTTVSGDEPLVCDDGTRPTVPEPTRWPEELALPEGLNIIRAQDNEELVTVNGLLNGDFQTLYDQLKAQFLAAGYQIQDEAISPGDGEFGLSGVVAGSNEDSHLSINLSEVHEVTSQGDLSLLYVLTPDP